MPKVDIKLTISGEGDELTAQEIREAGFVVQNEYRKAVQAEKSQPAPLPLEKKKPKKDD